MPPALIAHFFAPHDLNGDTIFECSTDDAFFKSVKLDIQREKIGGGTVTFARRVGEALLSRDILAPEVLVRFVVPEVDSNKYLHGIFLDARQQQVVSLAEKGGEGFEFGGPGPKFYLTRAVLWPFAFTGEEDHIERASGVWTWGESAKVGRILVDLLQEDAANPHGPFLPDLTRSFNESQDSDGDAWTNDFSGNDDLTLKIGDDFLKILWKLEDQGELFTKFDLGEIGDPKMELDAYQTIQSGGGFGRDLTGDLAADTVHLIEGVNIATDLVAEGASLQKASHAVVKGHEGLYEIAIRPSWSAGEYRKAVGIAYDSKNDDILDRAGVRFLRQQEQGEKAAKVRIVPGFDPENGLYMFGPGGTDGHVWIGDQISLTTGTPGGSQTVLDYNAEDQQVTGIEVELEEAVRTETPEAAARSFKVVLVLNDERQGSNTSPGRADRRGSSEVPQLIRFCRVTVPPEPDTPGSPVLSLTWGWETDNLDDGTSTYSLMATRSNSAGSLSGWWGWNGGLSTNPEISPRIPITAGQILRVQGDFSKQLAMSLQTSHIDVRFYTASVGGHIAGQDLVIGIPASGAGLGVVATIDESVVAPATAQYVTIAPYRNLYADDVTVTVSDVDTPGAEGRPGGGVADLVGTSTRVSRCGHAHHVFRDTLPSTTDDEEHGYPKGTAWIVVDDEDNPTQIFHRYRSLDSTDGAAVWYLDQEGNASDIPYDNTDSGLTADNLQDAVDEIALSAGGGSSFVGVRVRAVANVALTSGAVVMLTFDTEDYDVGGFHSTVTNPSRLTVPSGADGKYLIVASSFTSASPGNGYSVLRKNGSTAFVDQIAGLLVSNSSAGMASVSGVFDLVAGDYIEFGIQVGASSKSALDAGTADPVMEMHKIG